jgi:oligoribonuclease
MLGVFLDSEANGLDFRVHKILEIAYKIVDLKTGELKEEFQAVIAQTRGEWDKSDKQSLSVNGFTWEEVAAGMASNVAAATIIEMFKRHHIQRKKAVFICQNPSFDRVFFSQIIDPDRQEKLNLPYHWLDLASMYWAVAIKNGKKPWETGYSKDDIAAQYRISSEEKPHRAMNGVSHLLLCYKSVVGFTS